MQSIGVVFKKQEMVLVALKQGIADFYLEGYRIVPFQDLREEEREQAILDSIDRFVKTHKAGKGNLFIALPRDLALVQFLQIPAVAEENLGATLGFEIDRYTPFGFDDVYFDWHVLNRLPESGLVTVMLITIKRSIIDYYLELFSKLDIRPQGVEITTTALLNVYFKNHGTMERLQDMGWLRESGLLNDRTIGYIEKLSPKAARLLKNAPQEKTEGPGIDMLAELLDRDHCELAVIAEGRLCNSLVVSLPAPAGPETEYLQEIHDRGIGSLIYLPAALQDHRLPLHFRLSGMEMQPDYLEAAAEPLRESFSVQRELPVKHGRFAPETIAAALPVLALPAGLAIKGLRNTAFDVNLIPLARRPKRKKSKRKLVAGAVLLALVVVLTAYTVKRNFEMKERLQTLTQEVNDLRKQVQEIEDLQQDALRREKFAAELKNIRLNDVSKLRMLEELTRLIPDDSWLTEFNYLASEKKIKVSGFAVSAAKLIPILEESTLFDNVKFSTVITTDKRSEKERFRIEMNVSGEQANQ